MDRHFSLPKDGGILLDSVPEDILHSKDRIYTDVYPDEAAAVSVMADKIALAINAAAGQDGLFKLGFSSGTSPIALYDALAAKVANKELSFKGVEIFFIDEFHGAELDEDRCRSYGFRRHLLDKTDILPGNVHIPDSGMGNDEVTRFCTEYDKKAGQLDLLVLGMGEEGQCGFNESGAQVYSRTRTVVLSYNSRKRQVSNFGGDINLVPRMAVTMGMLQMLNARDVMMMAWGEGKAEIVRRVVEDKFDALCPASMFQHNTSVHMYVDAEAGSLLTREVAPWLLGPCDWTPKFIRKAVIWLSRQVGRPVLELSEKDYLQNSLDQLLEQHGPYDKINIDIFNDLQHTITGWPGGKPNADDSTRPVPSQPFPKRVLIFSPHPDDDVISMGGTFIRLVHQGHDVHVAYETSGNVAVHDDVVLQHMDTAFQLGFADRFDEVKSLIDSKRPGQPEPRALLDIKAAIRRAEARAADRSFGLEESHVHFLNLPFYESGGITKLPRTQVDVDIIKDLMNEVQPDQIYMAGDLADPHGTHRVCTEAAIEALAQCRADGAEWASKCVVWLYRGAWMEWDLGSVDMAVPISPAEVIEKRHAIYRHLSQKDIVPFPGEDPREFWQRAEDRTRNTAQLYSDLGMARYQAMEVFVRMPESFWK